MSPRPTGGGRTAKFARLNQLELYYETLGTGQPLVLIHGSLMTVSLLNDYPALLAAARRIREPVPVHLPAHHQVCLRHGTWLSRTGTPQFSVSECPGIIAAERQARRLLRRCTTEQLIHARVQAARQPGSAAQISWKQRMHALITSNPRAARLPLGVPRRRRSASSSLAVNQARSLGTSSVAR